MLEIFSYTFFQNALLGVFFVSIASALIGTYIVTRRLVFITGGITHACFGGLGLGYFLGINPLLSAGVFAVASSLGVDWMAARQNIREDSAIAVIWAFGMAVGTLFIFLTPGYVPDLNSFLFGNILNISREDIAAFAIFVVVLLAFFVVFYHRIVACAFDQDFARTMQLPVTVVNCVMSVFVAICIVLTIRLIGIMLLMSLLTMPQMIAELYVHRLKPMMTLSVVASLVSSFAGLFGSYVFGIYLVSVPASATIVISLILVYFISRVVVAFWNKDKLAIKQHKNR